MPIAAIPLYLQQGLQGAAPSPGLKFGLLLPLWNARADLDALVDAKAARGSEQALALRQTRDREGRDAAVAQLQQGRSNQGRFDEWTLTESAKRSAWDQVCSLCEDDLARMRALLQRQQALADARPSAAHLRVDAVASAPFTTGLGQAHPLENGFAFSLPHGLPSLAGSGVKGVLRRAARELGQGLWDGREAPWLQPFWRLARRGADDLLLTPLDLLFGLVPPDGRDDDVAQLRGALSFWDVHPQLPGKALQVEIMTPHQGDYYQRGDTPHDSGRPVPIHFLTVPPGAGFSFHIACDQPHLRRLCASPLPGAPDLLAEGPLHWKQLLRDCLQLAFDWLGFGAKTAVGYGALQVDREAEERRAEAERQAREKAEREARMAQLSEAARHIQAFIEKCEARAGQLRGGKDKPNTGLHAEARQLAAVAEGDAFSPDERKAAADAIEHWLPKLVQIDPKDLRKQLKLRQLRGEP